MAAPSVSAEKRLISHKNVMPFHVFDLINFMTKLFNNAPS